MYMLKCYDHRCAYVSLQPMYLMERVKLLTLAKHNIILLFYNEILQTCYLVDSCLKYRFNLAFMRMYLTVMTVVFICGKKMLLMTQKCVMNCTK